MTPLRWQRIRGPIMGHTAASDIYVAPGFLIVPKLREGTHNPVAWSVHVEGRSSGEFFFFRSVETLAHAKRVARDHRRKNDRRKS